jgi:hypothetical protein
VERSTSKNLLWAKLNKPVMAQRKSMPLAIVVGSVSGFLLYFVLFGARYV